MGGRLSVPKGPDSFTEVSRPIAQRRTVNGRTLLAPLAALTMAGLLFVYSRTSIKAAKLNAQKHREADGGQINWRNESLRRHGQLDNVDNKGLLKEALMGKKDPTSSEVRAAAEALERKGEHDSEAVKMLDAVKLEQKKRSPPRLE